jgi:hypothetical protein
VRELLPSPRQETAKAGFFQAVSKTTEKQRSDLRK